MSRHEGVSCDYCTKGNFRGRRYKCLICYDCDLCGNCYDQGATSTNHSKDHPMQCILTVSDFELYYGGETLGVEHPRSYTCPYCKEMGVSDSGLFEHVTVEHTDTGLEVVCPVCAALPGGEPTMVTKDFAGHLTVQHRNGGRGDLISFLDEPSSMRHGGVRRAPHAGRPIGVPRSRRSNMHFSSGSSAMSALSPAAREAVDPIAELLSQLSGVRRVQNPPSQLQQLQMQIQLERNQVTAARQQLERLPRRHTVVNPSTAPVTHSQSGLASSVINGREIYISSAPLQMAAATASQSTQNQSNQSQFLLSRFMTPSLQDTEQILLESNRADRSQFVQHLLLSTLSNLQITHESENDSTPTNEDYRTTASINNRTNNAV